MDDGRDRDNDGTDGPRQLAPVAWTARFAGFGSDTEELAFEVWAYRAGRSIQTTMKMLAEELPGHELPSRRTVERWRRDNDWDGEVTRRLQIVAPKTMENYAARFVELVGKAQDVIADGLASDKRDGSIKPGVFAAMQMQAKELHGLYWQMLQQGTAAKLAASDRQPVADEAMDPNERARRLRDKIAKDNRR